MVAVVAIVEATGHIPERSLRTLLRVKLTMKNNPEKSAIDCESIWRVRRE